MKRNLLFLLILALLGPVRAQEAEQEKKFGISFSGFVKADFFYDSRQTIAAREGHFLLWPAAENLDVNGDDINAKANFNFLAIQTRLKGTITGPDAFGAKTSAVIEGAFFGHSNPDINGFRLRHAFAKLQWDQTQLILGQYWHPMFVTGCFPGTVSFNTGVPFQPFSRNPQVRLTHKVGDLSLMVAAMSQRDFTSVGGSGPLRNSGIPDLQFQMAYSSFDDNGNGVLVGAGAGVKTLVPRLVTDSTIATTASVSSFAFQGFFKLKAPVVTVKLQGTYGQNLYDLLNISSFAVESINPSNDEYSYVPTSNTSLWADIHSNGKTVQVGLFFGYTQNLGASEDILWVEGTRGNIDNVMRVSPRVIFNSGKMRFATEIEYTSAAFGGIDTDAKVVDATTVQNVRLLFSAYYFF